MAGNYLSIMASMGERFHWTEKSVSAKWWTVNITNRTLKLLSTEVFNILY